MAATQNHPVSDCEPAYLPQLMEMPLAPDIDSLNKEFYLKDTAAAWYATKEFVLPEEHAFLNEFAVELKGKALLDIGIGAGRSTRYLLPVSANYVGVDYSPDMVREASKRFQSVRLEVRDARDLSAYADAQFDAVIFSFNGIDCLTHEGRTQALKEIHRVLRPEGIFAFSSHNRERPVANPWSLSNLNRSKHPGRMLRNLIEYGADILHWRHSRHCAIDCPEYALRHDSGNHFRVPMYYIDKRAQVAQLKQFGFETLVIFDGRGVRTDVSVADRDSSWIFYTCRKQG